MAFDDLAKRMASSHGKQLSKEPVTLDANKMLVDNLRADARSAATRDIVFGIVLLAVGIIVTSVTYGSASREGGTYVIAYGPIAVGLFRVIRGFARLA